MHAEALMDGDSPLAHRLTLQLCNFPLPTSHLAAPEVEQIEKGRGHVAGGGRKAEAVASLRLRLKFKLKNKLQQGKLGPSQRSHEVAAGRSKKLNIWLGEQPDDSWVVHPASSPANIALVFRASGKCQLDLNPDPNSNSNSNSNWSRRTAHYLLTKWNLKMSLCPWQQARDDDADADADGDDDVATCPM